MILDDAILDCARRLDVGLTMTIDDVEEQVRALLRDEDHSRRDCVLDVFGLGAVEWAVVMARPGRRMFSVGADDYMRALRHGNGCVPIDFCEHRLLSDPVAHDVVPMWGDALKVFGDDVEPEWRELATPRGARVVLDRLRELYADAAASRLEGYAEWAEARSDELRVAVWMLRAQALIDGSSGSTNPDGRRERATAAIDAFLHGEGAAVEVPAGAYR